MFWTLTLALAQPPDLPPVLLAAPCTTPDPEAAVVRVHSYGDRSDGVLVSPEGYVVTTGSVHGSSSVVALADGRLLPADTLRSGAVHILRLRASGPYPCTALAAPHEPKGALSALRLTEHGGLQRTPLQAAATPAPEPWRTPISSTEQSFPYAGAPVFRPDQTMAGLLTRTTDHQPYRYTLPADTPWSIADIHSSLEAARFAFSDGEIPADAWQSAGIPTTFTVRLGSVPDDGRIIVPAQPTPRLSKAQLERVPSTPSDRFVFPCHFETEWDRYPSFVRLQRGVLHYIANEAGPIHLRVTRSPEGPIELSVAPDVKAFAMPDDAPSNTDSADVTLTLTLEDGTVFTLPRAPASTWHPVPRTFVHHLSTTPIRDAHLDTPWGPATWTPEQAVGNYKPPLPKARRQEAIDAYPSILADGFSCIERRILGAGL